MPVLLSVLIISMGINVAVGCIVSYVLLDVVTTTVLYAHGSQLSTFTEDALNFNILQSALDIWGTVLLRASLLLGASLGVTWNKVDGPQRVAKSTSLILLICLIVITYTLAKLLMLTEVSISHQPWLLSLICWTCASSLGVMLLWRWLGKEPESGSSSSGRGARGREDTEKLVETVGEEEQELGSERKKEKDSSSGATLGRLLSYCKKDAELLSVAVLFLIISAVCVSVLNVTLFIAVCYKGFRHTAPMQLTKLSLQVLITLLMPRYTTLFNYR